MMMNISFLSYQTLGFYQAIATRTFISCKLTNDIYDVALYIDRCFKYNLRGFTWLCPMKFDDIVAQKPVPKQTNFAEHGCKRQKLAFFERLHACDKKWWFKHTELLFFQCVRG